MGIRALGLGIGLGWLVPAIALGHGGDGLEVTADSVGAPFDRIPRFCNIANAGSPILTNVSSGPWSSPSIWSGGQVPGNDARVQILSGTSVTYDVDSDTRLDCIEVQDHGALSFATDRSTKLIIDTLMVMPEGILRLGDATDPIPAAHGAEIVFRGDTALDTGTVASPGVDPKQYGKGLIVFGEVDIHGAALQPTFVRFAEEPLSGQSALTLESAPTGWSPGDTLIIPDTRQIPFHNNRTYTSQGEEVVIASVDGDTITLTAPLAHDHKGPRDAEGNVGPIERSMLPHVGNLSRNVVLRSEDPSDPLRRGHVLLLHRADIDIRYAEFVELGRTTIATLDSTTVDSNEVPTKIGTNQIGRYSIHLHHVMGPVNPTNTGYQLEIVGNVLHGMLKWGIAVHDTHYGLFRDNIAYAGSGSAIATEDGNEAFNVFEHNFVVHTRAGDTQQTLFSVGRGGVFNSRALFGTTRDAFWFSGEYNYVRDNVAANVPDFAYNYNGYYIKATMHVPRFRGADPWDPDEYEGWNYHGSGSQFVEGRDRREGLPVLESARNEAYGATGQGLWLTWARGCCSVSYYQQESLFEDYRIWHVNHTGVYAFHESRNTYAGFILRDDTAVSRQSGPNGRFNRGFWLGTASYENGQLIIRDFDIQGFNIGLAMPPNPQDGTAEPNVSIIENGVLKNHINLQEFFVANISDKTAEIRNVRFTPVVAYESNRLPSTPHNIYMSPGTSKQMNPMRFSEMYVYDFNGEPGNSFKVFWAEQAPDAIVLPPARPDLHLDDPSVTCPVQGLTNQQCWDQFGVAVAGQVAPCVQADGDDCSAAATRATALGISGLVFDIDVPPLPTQTPAPPAPTATATASATDTVAPPATEPPAATATAVPTATDTPTTEPTPTATDSSPPTATATATSTETPTTRALGCAVEPLTGCTNSDPDESSLVLYRGVRERYDRVRFRWRATDQNLANFPDPTAGEGGYSFCVYDYDRSQPTTAVAATAPADTSCGNRGCWRRIETGWSSLRYGDRSNPEGLRSLTISVADDGRARISVNIGGTAVDMPRLPLSVAPQLIAQLQSEDGRCWETVFDAPVLRNDRRILRAKE